MTVIWSTRGVVKPTLLAAQQTVNKYGFYMKIPEKSVFVTTYSYRQLYTLVIELAEHVFMKKMTTNANCQSSNALSF